MLKIPLKRDLRFLNVCKEIFPGKETRFIKKTAKFVIKFHENIELIIGSFKNFGSSFCFFVNFIRTITGHPLGSEFT